MRDRASASILDSYDEERRPHAVKMIRLAKLMGQLVMARSHARAFVVHGAMALLRRLPPMRRLFDDLGMKPENTFATGLFVRGRGGAWFPQDRVRWAGSDVLSDDVLGPDLALVGDVSLSAPAPRCGRRLPDDIRGAIQDVCRR